MTKLLSVALIFVLFQIPTLSPDQIRTVAWSPAGDQLAVADQNGVISIFETITGDLLYQVESDQPPTSLERNPDTSLAWNADGTLLATASSTTGIIRIWDSTSGKEVAQLQSDGTTYGAAFVAWNKHDLLAAITFVEEGIGTLRIWDTKDRSFALVNSTFKAQPYDLAWSPDGNRLAIADFSSVYIVEDFLNNNLEVQSHPPFSFLVSWSPDSSQLATVRSKNMIQVLDTDGGAVVKTLQSKADATVLDLKWSPDGSQLASLTSDGLVEIWDINYEALSDKFQLNHPGKRWLIDWSPYGGRLAIGNPEEQINKTNSVLTDVVKIVIPAPSLSRLTAIASLCTSEIHSRQSLPITLSNTLTNPSFDLLPDIITQIEALPEDAVPEGCAADLIAVAEAILTQ